MRFFDGQVHLAELLVIGVMTFLCVGLGFSWPVVVLVLLIGWPLLLLQLALEWGFYRLWQKWRGTRAKPAKRVGVARYVWVFPLLGLTLGYAMYVADTGRWFL